MSHKAFLIQKQLVTIQKPVSYTHLGAGALLDPKAFSVGMQQLSLDDFVPKALPDAAPAVQRLEARGMAAGRALGTKSSSESCCIPTLNALGSSSAPAPRCV